MAQEQLHQLHIAGPESSQMVMVAIGTMTIGRQAGNSLVLDHFLVSRRHAQLQCTPDECSITDLNSANGVVIDGQRLEAGVPVVLRSGMVFQIGPYNITYTFLGAKTPEPEPVEIPSPPPAPEVVSQPEVVVEQSPPVVPAPEEEKPVYKPGKPEPEVTESVEPSAPPDMPSLPPAPPVTAVPPPPPHHHPL